MVWVVAGGVFEVSVPDKAGARWHWVNPGPAVTLIGESVRDDGRHFRFRAEEAAAAAGQVDLRFRIETAVHAAVVRSVVVHVAPEDG